MVIYELLAAVAETASPAPTPGILDENTSITQPEATLLAGTFVGVGAILGFIAALLNRRSLDKATRTTDKRERESARHERYAKIAEQLASEKPPIQLSGVYSLSALSDEWQAEKDYGLRDSCIKLLCAHLRSLPEAGGEEELRTAFFATIESHIQKDSDVRWPGHDINLMGADVYGARLYNAILEGANLWSATMVHADFRDSSLRNTWFYETNLKYAHFDSVDFTDANFIGVDLEKAQLKEVTMNGATCTSAVLEGANIQHSFFQGTDFAAADLSNTFILKSDFKSAHLVGASLVNSVIVDSNFHGANLIGAKLEGANLSGVQFGEPGDDEALFCAIRKSGEGILTASWDERTQWPSDFSIDEVISRQLESRRGDSPPPSST